MTTQFVFEMLPASLRSACDISARCQGRDRVDNHNVDRTGAHKRIRNFQCLFAGVRLRDEHRVDVHADARGIVGVERVFRVDKCDLTAALLRLRHDVQRQRRLTG